MIKRVRTGAGLAALALAFWADGLAACDLMRELRPGTGLAEVKRKLTPLPVREMNRCGGGSQIVVPVAALCRDDTPGVRDARLELRFEAGQLAGWKVTRRGQKMELIDYVEKRLGRAPERPPTDVARPWANLHWQGAQWQAAYVGQGDGKEVMETLEYWHPALIGRTKAADKPECDRE